MEKPKKDKTDKKDKFILPENLQREMIKFFLKTSVPKLAEINRKENKSQSTPENNKKGVDENC